MGCVEGSAPRQGERNRVERPSARAASRKAEISSCEEKHLYAAPRSNMARATAAWRWARLAWLIASPSWSSRNQDIPSRIACVASGVERARSVSSPRSRNFPPRPLANSQLNSAVRAPYVQKARRRGGETGDDRAVNHGDLLEFRAV